MRGMYTTILCPYSIPSIPCLFYSDKNLSSDEYCPHCDNHFIIEAVTPKPALRVEGEDARMDSRYYPSYTHTHSYIHTHNCNIANTSVLLECSRMTAYARTKNDPSSTSRMRPIGWVDFFFSSIHIFNQPTNLRCFTISCPPSRFNGLLAIFPIVILRIRYPERNNI